MDLHYRCPAYKCLFRRTNLSTDMYGSDDEETGADLRDYFCFSPRDVYAKRLRKLMEATSAPKLSEITEEISEKNIYYRNKPRRVDDDDERILACSSKQGINWQCKFSRNNGIIRSLNDFDKKSHKNLPPNLYRYVYISWEFEWSELAKRGVVGLAGYIELSYMAPKSSLPVITRIEVDLTLPHGQWIDHRIGTYRGYNPKHKFRTLQFEFCFTPILRYKVISEYRMGSRSYPDTVLILGQNRMGVNRHHLAFQSAFFDRMFNSGFRESSQNEIPIHDVNYKDFKLLLNLSSTCSKSKVTDENVQRLLFLADRFMMYRAIRIIERQLMDGTEVPFNRLFPLADRFGMTKILDMCFEMIETIKIFESIPSHPEFSEFTEATRERLSLVKLCLTGSSD